MVKGSVQEENITIANIYAPNIGMWKSLSGVRLFATPWTVAYQTPLSMGFSRQEYWSGLPLPLRFYKIEEAKVEGNKGL